MHRIALALAVAGFEVEKVLEAAVLYTTGHGAEIDGAVYLLPGDYSVSQGRAALTTGAVSLAAMDRRCRPVAPISCFTAVAATIRSVRLERALGAGRSVLPERMDV